MKLTQLNTGMRVVLSFALVMLVMTAMSALALWRLHAADRSTSRLVEVSIAKQQLAAELLGMARLNGVRTAAIARSDSLEVSDYFLSQLGAGELAQVALEARLSGLEHDSAEQAHLADVALRKAAYLALRAEIFKLKDLGKTQEVGALVDTGMSPVFGAYTRALDELLLYQTQQAGVVASESAHQFKVSRNMLLALGALALLIGAGMAALLTRSIVLPLREAVSVIRRVAEGDLHAAPRHARSDEIGQLLAALADMTVKLAGTVGKVRAGAVAIDVASREIASANVDLSHRTELQASALEETASSVEELTEAVRQNNLHAHEANDLAKAASKVASQGGRVVAEVVETMGEISSFSAKIADIVGVIDGIAFQTNILALNAAVEAARAGEQRRGFAVVAGEVRNLAQRSSTAAREIKTLISDSTARIESGSALAHAAGGTMDEILLGVRAVTTILGAISAASSEQEAGISQINSAIGEMDVVTQQNAALVEEAAAAAGALHAQARELAGTVGYFKVAAPDAPAAPHPGHARVGQRGLAAG